MHFVDADDVKVIKPTQIALQEFMESSRCLFVKQAAQWSETHEFLIFNVQTCQPTCINRLSSCKLNNTR